MVRQCLLDENRSREPDGRGNIRPCNLNCIMLSAGSSRIFRKWIFRSSGFVPALFSVVAELARMQQRWEKRAKKKKPAAVNHQDGNRNISLFSLFFRKKSLCLKSGVLRAFWCAENSNDFLQGSSCGLSGWFLFFVRGLERPYLTISDFLCRMCSK